MNNCIDKFEKKAEEAGINIDKKKLDELRKKGSDVSDKDLFDTLPKDEQVMSINDAFMKSLFDDIIEDVVGLENDDYDMYLDNAKDNIIVKKDKNLEFDPYFYERQKKLQKIRDDIKSGKSKTISFENFELEMDKFEKELEVKYAS